MPREVLAGRQRRAKLFQAYPRLLFTEGRSFLESAAGSCTIRRDVGYDARPRTIDARRGQGLASSCVVRYKDGDVDRCRPSAAAVGATEGVRRGARLRSIDDTRIIAMMVDDRCRCSIRHARRRPIRLCGRS
jgi:hypothetical protein